MADLTFLEKRHFERLFGMSSGYVLDFSDRTFDEFAIDSIGRHISDERYKSAGTSKANRVRAFWSIDANHIVGKLMKDMVRYAASSSTGSDPSLIAECDRAADRLLQSSAVPDIEAISPNAPGRTFEALAKSVRESIEKNEPENGLDRLHTFVVKYIRALCVKHGLVVDRNNPLHSTFGEYVKHLKKEQKLSSKMSETILKSSISLLDAFSDVRNNQSFAHDNEILSYSESLLIFNNIAAVIRFIESIESSLDNEFATIQEANIGITL